MIANKPSNGTAAGSGMYLNLSVAEAEHSPTPFGGFCVKGVIPCHACWMCPAIMPETTIGLDDKFGRLENEIRLPTAKHTFVHLELETALLELSQEDAFDISQGETLAEAGFACLLARFRGNDPILHTFTRFPAVFGGLIQRRLPQCLSRLGRTRTFLISLTQLFPFGRPISNCSLAHSFTTLRRWWWATQDRLAYVLSPPRRMFLAKHCLAQVFSMFRCFYVASRGHSMFNYSIGS